jgi:hypothetical protein
MTGQENHTGTVHRWEYTSSSVTKMPVAMWDHTDWHTFYTKSGHNRRVHEHSKRTSLRHIRTQSSATLLSEAQTCTQVWAVSWVPVLTRTIFGDTRVRKTVPCAMTWDKQPPIGFVHDDGALTSMSRHTWKWLVCIPCDINTRIVTNGWGWRMPSGDQCWMQYKMYVEYQRY